MMNIKWTKQGMKFGIYNDSGLTLPVAFFWMKIVEKCKTYRFEMKAWK